MRNVTLRALCMGTCLVFAATAWCQQLVLVDNGKSPYRIVVALDATMQDYYAGQQLQRYVQEMTGVNLQIVADDNALSENEIIVGFNRHVRRLDPDLTKDDFGSEEFLIKTYGQKLLIVGGSPRGVLYGVNSLLTDELGCRWFTPLLKRIPKRKRLTLKALDRRYSPPFEWREADFSSGLDNEWAFHNFQNKDFAKLRPEQGWRAGLSHGNFQVHSALQLVPPEKYLKYHPEYYWTGEGDQPRSGRTTTGNKKGWIGICLTHPDLPKIAAQTLLDYHRQQQTEGDVYYSVSAQDYDDWCECPRCLKLYKRNGQPSPGFGPGHGAAWLQFAGKVQALLQNEPDAPKISVLVYAHSSVPPTTPVRYDKLNVIYAESNHLCQIHAIDDPSCPNNRESFRKRLAGWLKSAGSVYIWRYSVNFGYFLWVHPNLDTIADDLRYLRKVGVKGVFFQANQTGWAGKRFDGEMNELRAYLVARLMWNPDLDWRELRREFCEAYYGAEAGRVVEEYLDDVRRSFVEQKVHSYSSLEKKHFAWITPQMIARWYAYMDEAESLAADEEHKKLVRISRLPIQFTEAQNIGNRDQRREALQVYLDNARALGAANSVGVAISFRAWAKQEKLQWK